MHNQSYSAICSGSIFIKENVRYLSKKRQAFVLLNELFYYVLTVILYPGATFNRFN